MNVDRDVYNSEHPPTSYTLTTVTYTTLPNSGVNWELHNYSKVHRTFTCQKRTFEIVAALEDILVFVLVFSGSRGSLEPPQGLELGNKKCELSRDPTDELDAR